MRGHTFDDLAFVFSCSYEGVTPKPTQAAMRKCQWGQTFGFARLTKV
jgi:hypothetical protein